MYVSEPAIALENYSASVSYFPVFVIKENVKKTLRVSVQDPIIGLGFRRVASATA